MSKKPEQPSSSRGQFGTAIGMPLEIRPNRNIAAGLMRKSEPAKAASSQRPADAEALTTDSFA